MIATRSAGRSISAASKEDVEAASDLHDLNLDAAWSLCSVHYMVDSPVKLSALQPTTASQ